MPNRPHRSQEKSGPSSRPLEETLEGELLPRLVLAHRAEQGPVASAPDDSIVAITPETVAEFVDRLLHEREELASQLVASLMTHGASVESIYCELLGPAARQLGKMWEDDVCDFLQVTVGLGRLQHTLRDLSSAFSARRLRRDQPGGILITGLPDEQHTLGLLIVAEFFVRDGWAVNVGHPLIEQSLTEAVRGDWYDVVGFSLALPERVTELRGTINRVRKASRNPALAVLVGGPAFAHNPELVERAGADAAMCDVRTAPQQAREILRRKSAPVGETNSSVVQA
jgi:methanogenic corrinoid protein MtbC1